MRKIPTILLRTDKGAMTDDPNPECLWVFDGEGVATIKWDGSACLVHRGHLYRRRRVKEGKKPPYRWTHWSMDPKKETGHGWVPVTLCAEDRYHREAWDNKLFLPEDGTHELVGPAVQLNRYSLDKHLLWQHGAPFDFDVPRDIDGLKAMLTNEPRWEGIVWQHQDGRMAKLKCRDFGARWSPQSNTGRG